MTYDLPCMSYMAMYIISVHILNSNSKSSVGADHWKLNLDEGKVLQAENEKTAGSSDSHDDHLFSILTSTRFENGEWRVDSQIECVHCQHKEHENMEVRYGAVFLFLYIQLHPLSRIMSRCTLYTPNLQDESLQVIM